VACSTARLEAAPFQDGCLAARLEAESFPIKTKSKVKSSGQECPLHTSKVNGDEEECPSHTIENPHFSQKTREMGHPAAGAEARLHFVSLYAALKAPLFQVAARGPSGIMALHEIVRGRAATADCDIQIS
jgi:hypothetical protein